MKWNGKSPMVKLVTQTYETGVKLTKQAMVKENRELLTGNSVGFGRGFDPVQNLPPFLEVV